MPQSTGEKILNAVQKDDIKAFNALMKDAKPGNFRLGRFPVLSLMYMYRSRRILRAYGSKFLPLTCWEEICEPAAISADFSKIAGKCLRLYQSEIVSPPEMLLLLDKAGELKRIYPLLNLSSAVKERLKSIYYIRYSLNIEFVGDGIKIDRRPLKRREKRNIIISVASIVTAVAVAVGAPLTAAALIPERVEGEVRKLGEIDFSSKKQFVVTRDIEVPENFSVEKTNCRIVGGGGKLIFKNGASLGELNGSFKDICVSAEGTPLFTSINESAIVKNVEMSISADITGAAGSAFLALTNYGTVEGVNAGVSGKITARSDVQVTDDNFFAGLVLNNSAKKNALTQTVSYGSVKDCKVIYDNFILVGEGNANATFGGIAGKNEGYVTDCTAEGKITSDTFDLAGICAYNGGIISGSVNGAALSQHTASAGWNPIVSGIAVTNAYGMENCENRGSISSVSESGEYLSEEGYKSSVAACGIAYINKGTAVSPQIIRCANLGAVEGRAEHSDVYAAGVGVFSYGAINSCNNGGSVSSNAGNGCVAYSAGICALTNAYIYKSTNECALSAQSGGGTAYAGGIAAYSCAQILNCISGGSLTASGASVCAGGIFGFGDVDKNAYFGTAEYCISKGKITVESSGDCYAGGVAGFIREGVFGSGENVAYLGGGVTDSFFIGEASAEKFGNIVGVCGKDIYEINSYISGGQQYYNFSGNMYLANSFGAFYGTVSEDGVSPAEDKGAVSSDMEAITSSQAYKLILENLGE